MNNWTLVAPNLNKDYLNESKRSLHYMATVTHIHLSCNSKSCQNYTKTSSTRKNWDSQAEEDKPEWLRGTIVFTPLRVHLCSHHRCPRPRKSEPTALPRAHNFFSFSIALRCKFFFSVHCEALFFYLLHKKQI